MEKTAPLFAEIALALPVGKNLSYQVPATLTPEVQFGSRVLVPLGSRKVTGYVVGLSGSAPIGETKAIEAVLDPVPWFIPEELSFLKWIASYYCCSLGAIIKTALPPGIDLVPEPYLVLSDLGRKALVSGNLLPEEGDLLARLENENGVFLRTLRKGLKAKVVEGLLKTMTDKGYVVVVQRTRSPLVTVKKERFYRINSAQLAACSLTDLKCFCRRAPGQYRILKWIRRGGEATRKSILSHFGKVGAGLAALESSRFLLVSTREIYRIPVLEPPPDQGALPELTADQAEALVQIESALRAGKYAPFLLHGVTGSGKTEVYLRAIQTAMAKGQGALVLVPEIALTPQLIARFRERLGDGIAQIHSGLSSGERFDEWRRIRRGEVRVVIGARSAIFAPLHPLGVIVVDEEHDSAYKEEEKIGFNARDLALVKGKIHDAVVILGSATPMLETYHNTRIGKITYLRLPRRIDDRPLPRVELVDMRTEPPGTIFSVRLLRALASRWERGEQALLFLNRRGFAPMVLCQECGYTFSCRNCKVGLVYHQRRKSLRCHYCDYQLPAPEICPSCRGVKVEVLGFGTEKLESEMRRHFPQLRVGRLDRDTTARKQSLSRILGQFRRGELDLLIGTQMITKGHDLPRVTLVGVIAGDLSLNLPDFRAGERTFQLLTQVAGRSGRGDLPGEVIIQTYNPRHPSIQTAQTQDFLRFWEQEMPLRQELQYPPFYRLANFRIVGSDPARTRRYAEQLGGLCHQHRDRVAPLFQYLEILGPAEGLWEKLRGKYRWQMLIKGRGHAVVRRFVEDVLNLIKPQIRISGVKLSVDMDPLGFL